MPKIKTPVKKSVRRPKSRPVETKKRPPVARKKAKALTHKKPSAKKPTPAPVVTAPPLPTPLPVVAPSPAYKELPARRNRIQLWLAVLASTVIIGVCWLYFAQRNFIQLPNAVSESIENAQVDALVNDIQQNYTNLQDNIGTLSNIASQTGNQNANVNNTNTTPTNSNDELNNLFSDLQ